jgi:hypothetical protein
MTEVYIRQSNFSNGDVIDAPLFNAEYDQLAAVFRAADGHNHDGTEGGGAAIPFISDGAVDATGVFTNVTDPNNKVLEFRVNGVLVRSFSQTDGDSLADSQFLTHTPDGGVQQPLNTYLDSLEVAVGDAAIDVQRAETAANEAQAAAMIVGVPIVVQDGDSYTIPEDTVVADIISLGNTTINLPTALGTGRRFSIRQSATAAEGVKCTIMNPNFTIVGDILTLAAGDNLELLPKDLVVMDTINATTLEII